MPKKSRKTVGFNKTGIGKLPDNKPVVYKVQTVSGKNNYTGIAKRGRVQERIAEHLGAGHDPVPGSKVQIQQYDSLPEAKKAESNIIARSKPPHNKQGN